MDGWVLNHLVLGIFFSQKGMPRGRSYVVVGSVSRYRADPPCC